MPLNLPKPKDPELQQLDRRDSLMWGAAALLMFVLGVTVAIVYLAEVATSNFSLFPAPQTPGVLAGSLCGVIALFSLYTLLKHQQMQRLRAELIEARLRAESLQSRLFGLSSLFDGMAQVALHVDLEPVLETLADHVRATLQADQVSIMLLDPETQELECRAVAGMDAEFVRGARVKLGHGISGWVATQNQSLVLNRDDVRTRFPTHEKIGRNIASALCVPLALRDRVIGVLNINRLGNASPFTREDARLLTVFAAHAAIAIQRITEKRQDERLRQQQKMEALGRLAGGIAHDFNNQLTVILSYASRLNAELDGGHPLQPAAGRVLQAAERCSWLTRQLQAFGRREILQPEMLDLNRAVAAIGELLRRVIPESIHVSTWAAPDAGHVHLDRGHLEQIVVNLVLNARDAMPQGGILTVETAALSLDECRARALGGLESGPYAVVRVRDTGAGMDSETRARVFEPFFAATGTGHPGLGLASVYAITKQCGGHVAVTSEPGKGSTFEVFLPRVMCSGEPAAQETRKGPVTGKTVLLVEDEDVVRDLAREVLEMGGYEVCAARYGIDAIRLAETEARAFDLLLTDVIMPGMTGHEVAERLRTKQPKLPVLYMSGFTGEVLDHHGLSSSAAAFLQKPFTPQELLARVREAMRSSPGASAEPLDQAA